MMINQIKNKLKLVIRIGIMRFTVRGFSLKLLRGMPSWSRFKQGLEGRNQGAREVKIL